jgi:hypothetical protein
MSKLLDGKVAVITGGGQGVGWQHFREQSAALWVQSDVGSNGEEVIAIANLSYLVSRIRKYFQAFSLGGIQVASHHERPFHQQDEHIASLDVKRGNLVIEGEPAVALQDRDKFDLVRRRELQRPGSASYQNANVHAPGTRQSQNVGEWITFHS